MTDTSGQAVGKKVVLLMRYPYEAFRGGESTYIRALRDFLLRRGHDVTTIISDVVRGRRSPFISFPDRQAGRWRLRRAIPCGKHSYLCLDSVLAVRLVKASYADDSTDKGRSKEIAWIKKAIARENPDVIILLFGATEYSDSISDAIPTLALHGFFSSHFYELGEPLPSCEELVPASLAQRFANMPVVGLNNSAEVKALRNYRPADSVVEVGIGFQMAPVAPARAKADPVALFVGARSKSNNASLEWLLDGVWPEIVRSCPTARLRVVGSICSAFAERRGDNIDMVGLVPSIRGEYEAADVILAPLTLGSAGVKTKIAEAMSFGRPLVTTSLGVDFGKPDQFGDAVDVVNDPASFAKATIELLTDAALRAQRERLIIKAFQDNFTDEAAYGEMARVFDL